MNNHGIYIGNIQPCLYDRCRHQYVDLSIDEAIHDLLQFMFFHLSMGISYCRLWNQCLYSVCDLCNIIDTIVYIVDLSLSG